MTELAAIALQSLRARITGAFPAQVVTAVRELTDEQIWWRPNESSNSIGNLVLHLTGSIQHFLNYRIGGIEYARDRAAEFGQRELMPRAELLVLFEHMVARADETLSHLTPERLTDPSPEQKMNDIIFQDLLGIATHISAHAAQIVWIAKMLKEGAFDEVWIKAHRDTGVWKK